MTGSAPLLKVDNLKVRFETPRGPVYGVDGASFEMREGEILGIVGESGSGKSLTLRSILGLPVSGGSVSGRVLWQGRDLITLNRKALRAISGREISMIFQEPMTALNPVLTISEQICDNLAAHTTLNNEQRHKRAIELLDLVGIADAARRVGNYPHEFSGGMRQRAMIAIALAAGPHLLLADEPTTALDVTIQDQVLKLILRLRSELDMSVILVTHDLGVVAQTCDRVVVMYAGRVVEAGSVRDVFRQPSHAYTRGLLNSIPAVSGDKRALSPIPGAPPAPGSRPPGCPFSPRCSFCDAQCDLVPEMELVGDDHWAACWHYKQVVGSAVST